MTQHMAGMNVYSTNDMMGYSSQHTGASTTQSSVHMTAHVWKWTHLRTCPNDQHNRGGNESWEYVD